MRSSGVSVVICCYNSSSRLSATLEHLCKQIIPANLPWEIIIVDNASTDDTIEVAAARLQNSDRPDFDWTIVYEPKQGLSSARQKGVAVATYEYILFCDDDNWLCDDYLFRAFTILSSTADVGAVGGQSLALSDIELPAWFSAYEHGYAVGKQAPATGDITSRGYLWGAGLVTRKSLFLELVNDKYPSLLTDRKGNSISSAGDYEYCQRLILNNYKLYYDDRLTFVHYMPFNRLTEEYRNALFKSFEDSSPCITKYIQAVELKKSGKLKKIILLASALKQICKSFMRGQQAGSKDLQVLFLMLKINIRDDQELTMIRHFYRA